MVSLAAPAQCIELCGTVQVLPDHLTARVWQTVLQPTRTTARARPWTLTALAACWTAVILRAPPAVWMGKAFPVIPH